MSIPFYEEKLILVLKKKGSFTEKKNEKDFTS